MATTPTPDLFVIDGSNIATEGRSTPSLEQLNDAVLAFLEDRPGVRVTVVVDATFGHRIDKKEVTAFDEAVANNELVTPPAGAVGRGDAFVLSIAHKAKAGVLSNDSFQEFHGEYDWLFDEGRLVGGKPVPHVGWVFVERTPVRGPKSRQAVREAKEDATETKERANRRVRKKAAAAEPSAEPAPEPLAEQAQGRSRRGRRRRGDKVGPEQQATIEAAKASGSREQVNDLVPFLEFVERHPVGTSCTGVVESYASHGAYARVDDVLIYIPLRLMDDPPPRSARSVLKTGEAVALVIVGYVPDRRSVDAALPHMATDGETPLGVGPDGGRPASEPAGQGGRPGAAPDGETEASTPEPSAEQVAETNAPAKRAPAKKTAAKKAPAKKAPAKKAATTAPAKKTAAKKTAAKKAPAKKAPAKKAPAKKAPGKQTPAEQATTTSTATETAAGATPEQAPATPAAPTKAPAKRAARKTPAKKAPAKKESAKTVPAKTAPAKTVPAKTAPAKKAATTRSAATKRSGTSAADAASKPARRSRRPGGRGARPGSGGS